jgi:hypothetical protein
MAPTLAMGPTLTMGMAMGMAIGPTLTTTKKKDSLVK